MKMIVNLNDMKKRRIRADSIIKNAGKMVEEIMESSGSIMNNACQTGTRTGDGVGNQMI